MALTFRKLHPHFAAEVSAIDLREVADRGTHRGRAFDDARHRRELRRVTTLDIEPPPA